MLVWSLPAEGREPIQFIFKLVRFFNRFIVRWLASGACRLRAVELVVRALKRAVVQFAATARFLADELFEVGPRGEDVE